MQVYRHTNILLSGLYHMTKQVLLFDRLINFYNEFIHFLFSIPLSHPFLISVSFDLTAMSSFVCVTEFT